ncbi:MAG TPA: NAD-dependent deacylase [Thermoanaerobaculia bacterium]|nr:NAD-dependent deacylase [Thermoanaerobaculia bacterium]
MQESLKRAVHWIEEHRPRRIAALTGAGISAESGIPTFRDAGGLWESYRAEELATPQAFAKDPALVWRWYEWRRGLIRDAVPNDGHLALASLEDVLGRRGGTFTLITQNVDGLHRRAGSRSVIELHGNIFRVRCTREGNAVERTESFAELPPRCACGALLRPDVVWFGEMLPSGAIETASAAVADADLLLVIGTSGVVHPAAGLVSMLRHGGAIEVNPQETAITRLVTVAIQGPASGALPALADAVERSLG